MKTDVTNVLLVGVGGQGILLASEVLSEILMNQGYDVKKSEIHGMAQRGGSVISHVRYGEKVFSPIIPDGAVDLLFGFELLETARYLPLLKPGGAVLANNLKIFPPSVLIGQQDYPEALPETIAAKAGSFVLIEGLGLAGEAGDNRTLNTVLLGALSKRFDFTKDAWLEVLTQRVPQKALEANLKAFDLGRAAVEAGGS